jgi:hypothetical protein
MYIEKTLLIIEENSYDDPEVYARKVFELCEMLANHYDTIRYKYWKYVNHKFTSDKERAKKGPVEKDENEAESAEEQKVNGDD